MSLHRFPSSFGPREDHMRRLVNPQPAEITFQADPPRLVCPELCELLCELLLQQPQLQRSEGPRATLQVVHTQTVAQQPERLNVLKLSACSNNNASFFFFYYIYIILCMCFFFVCKSFMHFPS